VRCPCRGRRYTSDEEKGNIFLVNAKERNGKTIS